MMSRQFSPLGVHVLPVRIDDRVRGAAYLDVESIGKALFEHGFMPMPTSGIAANAVETCTRGIARLRGAMDRVAKALAGQMSPFSAPATSLLHTVRDWSTLSGDPVSRFSSLREILGAANTSQRGWHPEAIEASPRFGRDAAIVELYAAAQAVAAFTDAIRIGWLPTSDLHISRELRGRLLNLDLHAIARSAYLLSLVPPQSPVAVAARQSYGAIITELTVSRRLRHRCRDPEIPREKGKRAAAGRNSRTGRGV
jgi:hypothetical protein